MIEYAICTKLAATAAVTAFIGTTPDRIHAMKLPQGAQLPAITYQVVSDVPEYDMEGEVGVSTMRVQIECHALASRRSPDPYEAARQLGEAVSTALSGFTGAIGSDTVQSCFRLNSRVLHDDGTGIYRQQMDFSVGYTTA